MLESPGFRHATGKRDHGRNWQCECKPGLLGPPIAPLPVLLLSTLEHLAPGPPRSWKISQDSSKTTLYLTWTTNPGQSPNPPFILPPPLLAAVAAIPSPTWSLEQANSVLSCCLTWSTAPSVPATPDLNDSGYSSPSPSSPSSPHLCSSPSSPIPFVIPSSTEASSQTPSTTNQDSSSQVMTSMTSVGVQHSRKLQNTTENAATTTDRVLTVATCSQTPVHTFQATSTQTETTSCTTTSTGTQATSNFVPACPSNSENIINKHKKKSKQISQVKRADATTNYDPPPATPCHCRLCFEILDDATPAESHLLTCYELPKHAANLRSTFFQQHAKKTGIPAEALQNQSALFLTTHPIDDPEPTNTDSTKDYLIGQLFVSAMDEFEKVDQYHAALSLLLEHLKFNPSCTIDNLYYHPGIDPPPPDDEDPTDIHHPFDLLDLYPEDTECIDENLSNYDDDEF